MSFYQDKTVLVTGAAGFIGSNLVDALLDQGATVMGVDNFITGQKSNLGSASHNPNFMFIEADVINAPDTYLSTLNTQLSTLNCIFHLASPASPEGYQKKPIETYLVNSIGTHQLLQWMLQNAPQARFLYTSTSEVYGDPLVHPQKESYYGNVNPNGPRSMYDEAKRLGETICGVHHQQFELDTRIVRIFNTYGPRMDLFDGRVIPNFFKSILEGKPLPLHGKGEQTRSFCYVEDLVVGLMKYMETEGLAGETINIGNPSEVTMKYLADTICEVTKKQAEYTYPQARVDDPTRRCPDISKAKSLLHWEPIVDLHTGLQKTWEYFQKNS